MYCVQLPSGLTSFKSTFVKPCFQPKNTYNVKPDKLKATTELDKLKVTAKLDKLKASLPTLEAPQEPTKPIKPTIKRG